MPFLSDSYKIVPGLNPVADAFAGTVYSDAVHMGRFSEACFVIAKGVGTTGTSTITVEKCSAADGTGAEAIPFKYRRQDADGVLGSWLNATAAGFDTTAGSGDMYIIEVSDKLETLARGDKPWVRLKGVEVVDSPVAGGILILLSGSRYGNTVSAIA